MKKIISFLTGRIFIFGLTIAAQLVVLILLALYLSSYFGYAYIFFTVLSVITIFVINAKDDNPIMKLAWVIPIALFPLLGWLLYFVVGRTHISPDRTKRLERMASLADKTFSSLDPVSKKVGEVDRDAEQIINYVRNVTNFPVYENSQAIYLSPGERFFERLCKELEKAEKFIFMEYFIVEEGVMWDKILSILARKAREGVEVKMIYDDLGCAQTLPYGYHKKLREMGIKVHVFNVFKPSLDIFMNYRDHRKITVIDGKVGFTGGNNLADEYINAYVKHGYWKDSSIMITGDAVWSLSVLFLQMWMYYDEDDTSFEQYRLTQSVESDGFIMLYGDGPLDGHLVGETIYRRMIESAKEYISITTPYLILDNEMITALTCAAQSGVKVTIVTPQIPDKWYVHMITRYNYKRLIEAGVEIYEQIGTFIHSKTVVVDDEMAVVGTQNFDFRSFYLHFECGAFLFCNSTIADVRQDHLDIIKKSVRITLDDCKNVGIFTRILRSCINLFAPLM